MQPVTAFSLPRSLFPSGLHQPTGSFRFSDDALLLAAFALRTSLVGREAGRILDLGCGCGVIALACLLAAPKMRAFGVDCSAELVRTAEENAAFLGLDRAFSGYCLDLHVERDRLCIPKSAFDLVLSNMPYRKPGSGRLSLNPLRRKALFAESSTVADFLAAAVRAMVPDGHLALVYPWAERLILFAALEKQGLFVRQLLPLVSRGEEPGRCLLLAAFSPGVPLFMPPLVLHREGSKEYSPEAAEFCPWLTGGKWR